MRNRERFAWALSGLLVTTLLLGGGYQATNLQNGDVNGDGAIDVSDVVYQLQYLFEGGPEPMRAYGLIPMTGQTECYDNSGNLIACDDATYPGQDAAIASGAPLAERFVDNGDGTVTDLATRLMWATDAGPTGTWEGSLQYCEGLTVAGYTDWRMPNINEATSLVVLGTSWQATGSGHSGVVAWYDLDFFANPFNLGGDQWVWSSTTSTAIWGGTVYLTDEAFCLRVSGPGNGTASPALAGFSKIGQFPSAGWAVRGPG